MTYGALVPKNLCNFSIALFGEFGIHTCRFFCWCKAIEYSLCKGVGEYSAMPTVSSIRCYEEKVDTFKHFFSNICVMQN